jgi:hypothetical protein
MEIMEFNQPDIEVVLHKLRNVKKDIGQYQKHVFSDYGDFIIQLTNGRVRMYPEEIRFGNELLPERVKDIASRFRATPK